MGMIFLTSEVMEAVRGQKTPLRGQKWQEGVNLLMLLMKVGQQPQKPPDRSNQI